MSYIAGTTKCSHCGDLPVRPGRHPTHRGEPVCITCLRVMEENLPDFLDFLKKGGKLPPLAPTRKKGASTAISKLQGEYEEPDGTPHLG